MVDLIVGCARRQHLTSLVLGGPNIGSAIKLAIATLQLKSITRQQLSLQLCQYIITKFSVLEFLHLLLVCLDFLRFFQSRVASSRPAERLFLVRGCQHSIDCCDSRVLEQIGYGVLAAKARHFALSSRPSCGITQASERLC